VISGFVPVVNAEIYLVTVSALSSKSAVIYLVFISSSGQMVAKSIMYLTGRGSLKLPFKMRNGKLEEVQKKFSKWENKTYLFIFISASTGFPPFYFVSILAGMLKLNFKMFLIFGFIGRALRFSLVILFPQLLKGIF
jgi:membrane protein YqaA with SNARE-associated domain